mgnify:CR=1 FL=1
MSIKNDINKILLKKFPHLEISVVKYSEVQTDNESKRIDSEYFRQEYLENKKFICKNEYKTLEQLSTKITNGHTPYGENLSHNEIKFITAEFMEDFFIKEVKKFISYESHTNYLKRSILKNGDIIFSIKGKIGNAVPIFNMKEPLNINQDIARISINIKEINIFYLSAFLNSQFGKKQTEQEATGQINPFIPLGTLKQIKIPIFPKEFQLEIETMVKDSHKALENSKKLYKEAEKILYEALGLDAENPLESILSFGEENKIIHSLRLDGRNSKSYIVASPTYDLLKKYKGLNISIRTYKESYLKMGRLDAEYYQVKYDLIENIIKDYYGGYDKLDISEIKDANFIPNEEEKYRYIELANIVNGNITEPLEDFGKNLPTRARRKVKTGDLIISSVEGSLSSCALITEEFDNCLVSTGFYVLKSNFLNSETLLVIFRSELFQKYLNKFPSGTILNAISKDGLKNILIPHLDLKTQRKIEAKVKQSFELRDKSKELLENAKVKIENAIIDS